MQSRDTNILSLELSAVAVLVALLWAFFGRSFIELVASPDNADVVYIFFSGIMLSMAFVGIIAFVKTILCLTEFMVEPDSLPSLVYRSVMDDDSEGVFFKDRKGRYKIINPISKKVLDIKSDNIIGCRDSELHPSVLAHKIELEDRRVLDMGETIVWEAETDTGLGHEAFLCKKIPCYDRNGRIIGITGLCKNITILKTFQNLNSELEERYHQLFNRLPFPVLVLDISTMLPFAFNQPMADMLGYSRQEFGVSRFTAHMQDESVDVLRSIMRNTRVDGGGEFEFGMKTREKDLVAVIAYAQEIVIKDKKYLNIIFHDVTELKRSTNELISSELKYRSLFEHANDAILIFDIKTLLIVDANDVALSFFDYSRDELKSLSIYDLDATSNHKFTYEKLNELEVHNHVLYEQEITNRKNQRRQVEINAHKLNYGSEEVFQFVIRDISERKKTEQALIASEQRYRQMFESNRAIKMVVNPEHNTIEDANQAAAEFYGYTKKEMQGMPVSQINVLDDEKLKSLVKTAREQSQNYYTCPHKLSNGDIRFVEVRDGPMDIDGQELLYSIVHDVTASKHAEDQLILASKMFDCSSDAAMITDSQNHVLSVNHAFTRITGYQQSEILGKEPEIIMAGRNQTLLTEEVLAELEKTGQWQGEAWHRLKNGETRPLKFTINIILDDHGVVSNYVIFMATLSSIMDDDSSHKTHYTSLTGLPDRALFADRMQYAIDRCRRAGKQLALLLIDFRGFSDINQRYGFDVGDSALKAIARRLKYNVRESDCVAHFSADDFAVFLEDLADIHQAGVVAQKIISTLTEGYQVGDRDLQLEVSIGISISPGDGIDVSTLMQKASLALRNAQQISGNQFRFASSQLDADAHVWLQTEQRLHRGLRNDELFIQYLPQYRLGHEEGVEALEALVRWQYDENTVMLPKQFLPMAEQSGFMSIVGQQVLNKSVADFSEWFKKGMVPGLRLHVNLCQTQIDEDLPELLIDICNTYNLPCSALVLEFLESKFINITHEQKDILRQLHENGFGLCIDDFGRGEASLACLMQCPIDAIKIDATVIKHIKSDSASMSLVKGILAIADTLDIEVIAEGVESDELFKLLVDMGCRHMQGYYFAEPAMPGDVPQLITVTEEQYET